MRFIGSVAVTNGGSDPDPVAAPGDVPDANLVGHEGEGPIRDRDVTQRLLCSFLGSAPAQTTTVEIWALDQATAGGAAADRKFYLVVTGLGLTHLTLTEVTGPVPAQGPFYVRQTGGAADGTVKVAVQGG